MYRNMIDIYSIEKLIIYLKKIIYIYYIYIDTYTRARARVHIHIVHVTFVLICLHSKYIWSCTQLYVQNVYREKLSITKIRRWNTTKHGFKTSKIIIISCLFLLSSWLLKWFWTMLYICRSYNVCIDQFQNFVQRYICIYTCTYVCISVTSW